MAKRKNPAKKAAPKKVRDPFDIALGRRLVVARKAAGFATQAAFAEKLGVSPSRLSNWENGWNSIPPGFVLKIYMATRITADWLFLSDPTRLPGDVREIVEQRSGLLG